MPLTINLRHLQSQNVLLQGQIPTEDLDIETLDDMICLGKELDYNFEVQKLEDGLLLEGRLSVMLDCRCVRCLKPFEQELALEGWTCHLPLAGEEAVPVNNDCVDLTPFVREDILLEFPQHPLCNAECRGLPDSSLGGAKSTCGTGLGVADASAWAELNKLKL
jgi:uncharacterized metal-binding protein YceD (DUF177 family)